MHNLPKPATGSRLSLLGALAALLVGMLGFPPAVLAQAGAFDTAALRPAGETRAIPRIASAPVVHVRSRTEALRQLQRIEVELGRGSAGAGASMKLDAELKAVESFLAKKRNDSARDAGFQWHRAGDGKMNDGGTRLVLRPKNGVPYISAVRLEVRGAPRKVEMLRAYGASGLVFEFRPERVVGAGARGRQIQLFLDREIVLSAVEVFLAPQQSGPSEFALLGGIAIEPPTAMNALYSLKLARKEIDARRFEMAAFRIRESMNFVRAVR